MRAAKLIVAALKESSGLFHKLCPFIGLFTLVSAGSRRAPAHNSDGHSIIFEVRLDLQMFLSN